MDNQEDAKEDLADASADLDEAKDDKEDAGDARDGAQAALDSAKSAQASAQSAFANALAAYNTANPDYPISSFAEADSSKEGYSDLQAADTALKDADSKVSAAQTALNMAQTAYDSAKKALETAQAAYDNVLKTYENAVDSVAQTQKQNERQIANAADQVESTQMQHQYSNDSSEQQITNYQDQIDSCTVVAPISGVITAMNVAVGDTYMGEGNTMFSIADNEHFIVQASVDEYEISAISKDMAAAVIVEALGEEELPAKVSFVAPTASSSNTGSASYKIEIALDDVNTDLRIGMTAKASVVKDAVYDVLTVPYDCVQTDEEGNSVICIDKDGVRTEVPVTVGMESDYYVEISGDGLEENTRVYYSEPMANNDSQEESDATEMMKIGMPGGGMPTGGGGNRGGGGPGAPGGF